MWNLEGIRPRRSEPSEWTRERRARYDALCTSGVLRRPERELTLEEIEEDVWRRECSPLIRFGLYLGLYEHWRGTP